MYLFSPIAAHISWRLTSLPQVAAVEPSRVQCRQWDQVFLSITESSIAMVFIASLAGGLIVGALLGKRAWWAAAPYLRIAIVATAVLATALFAAVLWPAAGGLGLAWMSGVDPAYLSCRDVAFGAEGFFGGAVGADVAALSQMPAIVLMMVAAAGLGGLLCLVLTHVAAAHGPYSARRV